MKFPIMFWFADPADVIDARRSFIGHENVLNSEAMDVAKSVEDLVGLSDLGCLVGKEEVLEYFYEDNHLEYTEEISKTHNLIYDPKDPIL